jgi:hypothetical protein
MTVVDSTSPAFQPSDGAVPALTSDASTAAPQNANAVTSSLASLNAGLSSLVDSLKGANAAKDSAGDALSQVEKLFGIGQAPPAQPSVDQGQSILGTVAVVALLLLGGAIVWRLVKG